MALGWKHSYAAATKPTKNHVIRVLAILFLLHNNNYSFMSTTVVAATMKNAVVTGANRGLGLEICKQLHEGGIYSSIYALCRKSSDELSHLASASSNKVKIVENIDVMKENVGKDLQQVFQTTTPIHLLIHNAGAYGSATTSATGEVDRSSQSLEKIDTKEMQFAFQLNTVAPLMVTQALLSNLEAAEDAKVVIISSAMGSIEENGSGGHYGYRASKAAVNMVGKGMSVDLKDKKIAVGMIHPGYVYTGFSGKDAPRQPGQRGVEESTRGVLQAVDQISMDTTGSFLHGNYGEGVKPMPW